jgi:sulfhydrogenase subunit gamma (sulfur reductase)
MNVKLNLTAKNDNLYLPVPAKIIEIKEFTAKEKFFRLELPAGKSLGHVPAQFVMVSIFGIGEAPISISSPPSTDNKFELCVRAVGDVTNNMHKMKVGDVVHIRGPFGHGYEDSIIQSMQGKQIVFIAGGLGYAPVRSLINKVIPEHKNYEKVFVLYGYRNPSEKLYDEETKAIAAMGGNVEYLETVDKADSTWKGNVGVITTLIPKININPDNTVAVICGPPIMYKFVVKSLLERKVPKENIYMSLERRMKCGVGKCGHCQMEGVYVCQEGPVFTYANVEHNEEAL